MKSKCLQFGMALSIFMTLLGGFAPAANAQTSTLKFPAPNTFLDEPLTDGGSVNAVAVGDFNNDGKLDVLNISNGSSIDVLLGNGNGTFQTPVSTSIGAPCTGFGAVAVGDFNGDGILDAATWGTTCSNSVGANQINIYLGTGNGNFTAGAIYNPAGSRGFAVSPTSIVAEDVNGDGKLDLIALTQYNGVYVLLGNGDGTFQTPVNYATTNPNGTANGIAVGDVNGDGHPDFAIADSQGMEIMLNSGTGTFGTPTYYANGYGNAYGSGSGIAIGVLKTGGKPDVVAAVPGAGVVVFLNQGNGTFTVGTTLSDPNIGSNANIILAPINSTSKVLGVVVPDQFGNVFTFLGKGNGTFDASTNFSLEVYQGTSLIGVGDFNEDGALDVVQTSGFDTNTVSLGRGDGTFQTAQMFPTFTLDSQSQNIAVADFNGDGFADVAMESTPAGTIGVILGSSHGALTAKPITVTACSNEYVYWIATGDVNGDGKPDLVATLGGSNAKCNHMVAVMLGEGTGHFAAAKYYATNATAQENRVYLADMNGDGKLDIVMENMDGSVSVLLNKGSGTFSPGVLTTSGTSIWSNDIDIAIADFNGDGKNDIAVTTHAYTDYSTNNFVYVLPGNGNGTFGSPVKTTASFDVETPVAYDFNGDGKVDLVVAAAGCNSSNGSLVGYEFLKGNGDGTFTNSTSECYLYGGTTQAVTANLNGTQTVVISVSGGPEPGNSETVGPVVIQSNGKGGFTPLTTEPYTGYGNVGVGVGDFNGDGMPDLAFVDSQSFVSVLLNATNPVSVSPVNLNFGSVDVSKSKSLTVVLTNNQTTSLAIDKMAISGTNASDFTETNTCTATRKAGWDCTITVKFTPTAAAAASATLSITDGAGTQTVQLSGTGIAATN